VQLVTFDALVQDDLDGEVIEAQDAAGVAGADPGADGEHQRRGQRSLADMEQPKPLALLVLLEEAVGTDGADDASGMEKDGNDVARRHDRVWGVEPGTLVSHKAALGRRRGRGTRVAHGDLRRIRRGRPRRPMPH
jgi:hypothetical protein